VAHDDEDRLIRDALSDAFDIDIEETLFEEISDEQIERSVDSEPIPVPRQPSNSQLVDQVSQLWGVLEQIGNLIAEFSPSERVVIMARFCPYCGCDWELHDCECGFARPRQGSGHCPS
jgi:hypothetical protein